MVRKSPSLSYHFVGFLDALDYLFFGATESVDNSEEYKLRLGKRLFTVVVATVVIILLAILIAIIVIIVRLNSNAGSEKPNGTATTSKPTVTQPVPASIITYIASSAPTEASTNPSGASSVPTKTPGSSSPSSFTTTTHASTSYPRCMIVGDVLNLGYNETLYKDEQRMINDVASMLLSQEQSKAGIWGYGHVVHSYTFLDAFKKTLTKEWSAFSGYLGTMMELSFSRVHPSGGNPDVFLATNNTMFDRDNPNCLVFLSAMTNVSGYKLDPREDYKRIVVVNLAGGDFSEIVDERRGTIVEVSQPYDDEQKENAKKIHNAIQKDFHL